MASLAGSKAGSLKGARNRKANSLRAMALGAWPFRTSVMAMDRLIGSHGGGQAGRSHPLRIRV